MSGLQALLLGAVQGLTEFLPVSSSAHLVILPALLGWPSSLSFDVAAHLGTALATLIYFRADWWRMARAIGPLLRRADGPAPVEARLLGMVILGTIPVALVGLGLRSLFEELIARDPVALARMAAALMLLTGLILVLAEKLGRRESQLASLGPARALGVGLAQALAILPGISRSGATISGGLFAGLERTEAARFSFLLSLPAILGAGLVQGIAMLVEGGGEEDLAILAAGFLAAFSVGYLTIAWFIGYLRRARLYGFAVYTWIAGLAVLWWLR